MSCATRSFDFLAGMVTRTISSPEGSPYCRVSAYAYALQRGIPSPRAGVTPRSRTLLHDMFRNLNRMSITCPSRVPLSSRLTLIRLTLFRKPWVFGAGVLAPVIVTYAYIFLSGRSSKPHGLTFYAVRNAPLPLIFRQVHGFGGSLDARSSSTQRRSTSELLRTL